MLASIISFLTDYLRGKPITDVLLIMMLGLFAADRYYETTYREPARAERAKEAHSVMRQVIQDHDALAERNADRIVSVLTGVRQDVKKTTAAVNSIPEAAAVAAKIVVEQKEAKPAEPPGL